MDTNLKNAISAMRNEIAELEKEQKTIKPQRKTVYYTGERTLHPWEAAEKVRTNKHELRILYAAYGLLKGNNFDVTENAVEHCNRDNGNWCSAEMVGKHPLCEFLPEIDAALNKHGYQLKNYEEKEDYWKRPYKKYNLENYEEVVRISE